MAIDPSIFPLENLILDRLFANLVESEDTVRLLEGVLTNDLATEERDRYEARLAEENDQVALLRELIKLKRQSEMEKL